MKQYIWKFPVGFDLNKKVNTSNPENGITKMVRNYNGHFGDLEYYEGKLFVTVSSDERFKGSHSSIELYDADTLKFIRSHTMIDGVTGEQFESVGWCAVNPNDGLLYTSNGAIKESKGLLVYQINKEAFTNLNVPLLTFKSHILLKDEEGKPLSRGSMQGGCFDYYNYLHITNGYQSVGKRYNYNEGTRGGISVYYLGTNPTCSSVRRITNSTQSGTFRFQFTGAREEPEGITYLELDSNTAPKITGSLHAIMLDNSGSGDDDLYFKHYKRDLMFVKNPDSVKVKESDSFILKARAAGGVGPYSYQWLRFDSYQNKYYMISDDAVCSGTRTDILKFNKIPYSCNGCMYAAMVTDSEGKCSISERADVSVIKK